MPHLLDLPDEILHKISISVSAAGDGSLFKVVAVNRRLNALVTPLLVHRWPPSRHNNRPRNECLALHLARHPELRGQVRHLELGSGGSFPQTGGHFIDPFMPKLGREQLEEIAAAVAHECPKYTEIPDWAGQVREGAWGAISALLLTWATNLTHLEFTVPSTATNYPGEDVIIIPMWATYVVRQMMNPSANSLAGTLPLMNLRHVLVTHEYENLRTFGRYTAPFFYLPNMRTFVGRQVGVMDLQEDIGADVRDKYLVEFPVGTSTIEEIVLEESEFRLTELLTLIRACRRLTTLVIGWTEFLETTKISSNQLAQVILHHTASLETLGIIWSADPLFDIVERPSDGPLIVEESFRHLSRLEKLTIPIWMLFEADGGSGDRNIISGLSSGNRSILRQMPRSGGRIISTRFKKPGKYGYGIKVSRLPRSIRYLKLVGKGTNAAAKGVEALLLACGPGGELPNLKEIDLASALDGNVGSESVGRIKAAAAATGVYIAWAPEPESGLIFVDTPVIVADLAILFNTHNP